MKWWMAKGPDAMFVFCLFFSTANTQETPFCTMAMGQGVLISLTRRGQISASATRAAVAANDIWKPGCTMDSGRPSRTIPAAKARALKVMALRSSRMAAKAIEAVAQERTAGAGAPETTRLVLILFL